MTNSFYGTMLGLLAIVPILSGKAHADTFEFLTYTPPPGWTNQSTTDGFMYRRANGIGLVAFYPSYATTGSASGEYARLWRARVEPSLPGPAPQPEMSRDGDYTAAVGVQRVDAQGTITTIAFVAFVGRGRAIGVLAMVAGDDATREVTAFLDSLGIAPGTNVGTTANSSSVSAGGIEVDIKVPPGYVSRREGDMIALTPTTLDSNTPCIYGVSPARPSRGSLEVDARAALLEPHSGWQLKNGDQYNAMRGTAGAGWPYYWFRTDIQNLAENNVQYVMAMAMAFPAGPGRVNIVWGVGSPVNCTLNDIAFARLFQGLSPRGWTSDGGKALARDLVGTWRNIQSAGMKQYKFMANGRYEYGIGTVVNMGMLEKTSSSVSDGRYELRGGELTLIPDRRDRDAAKYRIRVYDEYNRTWIRALALLNESSNPPLDVEYVRIEDSR